MCRVSLLHTCFHRISASDLLVRTGLFSIDTYVTRRQLRWLGHTARMGPERLPRKMLTAWVMEKRCRGAPEYTYGRGMYKAMKKFMIDKSVWYNMARDRFLWRNALKREC